MGVTKVNEFRNERLTAVEKVEEISKKVQERKLLRKECFIEEKDICRRTVCMTGLGGGEPSEISTLQRTTEKKKKKRYIYNFNSKYSFSS